MSAVRADTQAMITRSLKFSDNQEKDYEYLMILPDNLGLVINKGILAMVDFSTGSLVREIAGSATAKIKIFIPLNDLSIAYYDPSGCIVVRAFEDGFQSCRRLGNVQDHQLNENVTRMAYHNGRLASVHESDLDSRATEIAIWDTVKMSFIKKIQLNLSDDWSKWQRVCDILFLNNDDIVLISSTALWEVVKFFKVEIGSGELIYLFSQKIRWVKQLKLNDHDTLNYLEYSKENHLSVPLVQIDLLTRLRTALVNKETEYNTTLTTTVMRSFETTKKYYDCIYRSVASYAYLPHAYVVCSSGGVLDFYNYENTWLEQIALPASLVSVLKEGCNVFWDAYRNSIKVVSKEHVYELPLDIRNQYSEAFGDLFKEGYHDQKDAKGVKSIVMDYIGISFFSVRKDKTTLGRECEVLTSDKVIIVDQEADYFSSCKFKN